MSVILAVILSFLPSCALFPQEEELPAAPLVEPYAAEPYSLAYVKRGNLELTKEISVSYIPVKTETLSFDTGGELIDEIFVTIGDTVKASDLLAQLALDRFSEQLSDAESLLESNTLQLAQLEENRSLALERQRVSGQKLDAAAQSEAIQELNARYDKQKRDINDKIYINQMKVAELTEECGKRQLRSGIDGTVIFVKKIEAGELSSAGNAIITISDLTLSAFHADTDLWPHMNIGDEFNIVVDGEEYEAVVADEKDFGIPPQQKEEGQKASVYLTLKPPLLTFDDGTGGKLTLTIDRRENVLVLPVAAITSVNGEKIVYYQDDVGVRSFKKIQTGLQVGNMIEIIGGLAEEECVILP